MKRGPTQTQSGKAFEYALAKALYEKVKNEQQVTCIKDQPFINAHSCFKMFDDLKRKNYMLAANVAVNHIIELEPCLVNPIEPNAPMEISIRPDADAISGDVRDVITLSKLKKENDPWEIGFSAKNNHNAVKHSRLSDSINFGKQWLGIPCSRQYMQTVKKIFGEIRSKIQKNPDLEWGEIKDKHKQYYKPILNAFCKEMKIICKQHKNAPEQLIRYLIGTKDFYKVMKFDNYTKIQGYNLNGTLNRRSDAVQTPLRTSQLRFPKRLIEIEKSV